MLAIRALFRAFFIVAVAASSAAASDTSATVAEDQFLRDAQQAQDLFHQVKDKNLNAATVRYSMDISSAIRNLLQASGLKQVVAFALGSLAHGTMVPPSDDSLSIQPTGSDVELFCVIPKGPKERELRTALSKLPLLLSRAGLRFDSSLFQWRKETAKEFVFTRAELAEHVKTMADPAFQKRWNAGVPAIALLFARPLSGEARHGKVNHSVETLLQKVARSVVGARALYRAVQDHATLQQERGTDNLERKDNFLVAGGSLARGEKAMTPTHLFPDIRTVKETTNLLAAVASQIKGTRPTSYCRPLQATDRYWDDLFAHISDVRLDVKPLVTKRQWHQLASAFNGYNASRSGCRGSMITIPNLTGQYLAGRKLMQPILDIRRSLLGRLTPSYR